MALLNNADEPEWIIPSEERLARLESVQRQIDAAWEALPAKWPVAADDGEASEPAQHAARKSLAESFSDWNQAESQAAVDWQVRSPQLVSSTMPHLVVRNDGTVLGSGDATKSDVYELILPAGESPVRALRL